MWPSRNRRTVSCLNGQALQQMIPSENMLTSTEDGLTLLGCWLFLHRRLRLGGVCWGRLGRGRGGSKGRSCSNRGFRWSTSLSSGFRFDLLFDHWFRLELRFSWWRGFNRTFGWGLLLGRDWIWPVCPGFWSVSPSWAFGWALVGGGVWGLGWIWGLEFLRTGGTGFGGSGLGGWGFAGSSIGFPGVGSGAAWAWALGCCVVVGGWVGVGPAMGTGSWAGTGSGVGSWLLGCGSWGFTAPPRFSTKESSYYNIFTRWGLQEGFKSSTGNFAWFRIKTKAPPRLAKVTIQRVMPKVSIVLSTKTNVFTPNKQTGQLACSGIIGVDVKSNSCMFPTTDHACKRTKTLTLFKIYFVVRFIQNQKCSLYST